ncbi:MAG: ATP-binding protein [Candidatus Heimdallarchaeota archaeon]|nr:ATP-binding protein [Candidatus Heimdallarchaeota archaeon]
MARLSKIIADIVLENLILISGGEINITEDQIRSEEDDLAREIFMGLLILHEELKYKEERQKELEKELRERERLFRGVFENAPLGIALLNLDRSFNMGNPQLLDMLNYTIDELKQKNEKEIIFLEESETTTDDDEKYIELTDKLIESFKTAKRYLTNNDQIIWTEITSALIEDELKQPEFIVSIIEDITKRKIIEDELMLKSEELKRSNAELEQFAYVSSHDLREPLRNIATYSQLILKRYSQGLDERVIDWLTQIKDSTARMQNMIRDLLQFSRIGRVDLKFVEIELKVVILNAINNLNPLIFETGTKITYDEKLPFVIGVKTQLILLFQNLINNAIKYSRKGIEPEIKITVDKDENNWIISVMDNGIGISEKYFQSIFVIFQRLHSKTEYSGTGIGLSICRKIVDFHNGKIWLTSKEGEGTNFYFTLPIEQKSERDYENL